MFGSNNFLSDWKKPKAAIYVRVSTINQAEKGYGLEAQISMCRKMCDIKNYELANIYTDSGISGTVKAHDRKGFNELLSDAQKGDFEILVFYTFDRLARDIRVFLSIVDELKKIGLKIVSCKENIDTTTADGEFMMNIYASVSHLELQTIKGRLAMGREQKKLKDGYVGGSLPYGYSMVDKIITANDFKKVITINYIYDLRFIHKLSLRKIAEKLDDKEISTPRGGKTWNKNSISIILKNKHKYEGSLINNNTNNVRWPLILINRYPDKMV